MPNPPEIATPTFLRRLISNRSGAVGLVLVTVYLIVGLLGWIGVTPYPALEQHARDRLQAPSATYLMGTDLFGRDIASRIMGGAANSLRVALLSVSLATAFGTLLGTLSGYFGGLFDIIVMRVMDVFFALPALLLALVVVSVLGPGMNNTVLAIGTVYTPIFARVARGPVLAVKQMEFVQAARCIGAGNDARILYRHVLPNTARAIDCAGEPRAFVVAAHRSRVELPRLGDATAAALVGCDVEREPGHRGDGSMADAVSRAGDHARRAWLQPAWRWSARCARSPVARPALVV